MKLVLLGAAGSGKGTLAKKITADFGIPQISTGDLFREIVKTQSPLGSLVKSYIDKGALVPNEVTFDVLKNRISQKDCKNGFILDGFPRSLEQALVEDRIMGPLHLARELIAVARHDPAAAAGSPSRTVARNIPYGKGKIIP